MKDQKFYLSEVEKWPVKKVYCLELKSGRVGFSPAVIRNTLRMIVVLDEKFLSEKIWPLLPNQKAEILSVSCYVNEEMGIAFPEKEFRFYIENNLSPYQLLLSEEFKQLITNKKPSPFEWAIPISGNNSDVTEFFKSLQMMEPATHSA